MFKLSIISNTQKLLLFSKCKQKNIISSSLKRFEIFKWIEYFSYKVPEIVF